MILVHERFGPMTIVIDRGIGIEHMTSVDQ